MQVLKKGSRMAHTLNLLKNEDEVFVGLFYGSRGLFLANHLHDLFKQLAIIKNRLRIFYKIAAQFTAFKYDAF